MPRPPRLPRLALAGLACAAALAACLLAYQAGARGPGRARPLRVDAYAALRAPVVSHQDAQMPEGGFVLLAGDSHAELAAPAPNGCGRTWLNAGISGARAGGYADFLGRLDMPRHAAVAVVTLGTNHLLRKDNPAGEKAADAYEAELSRAVAGLRGIAVRVLVAAVPPVPAASDRFVDVAGVQNLTARQARVCARLGCETVDPYASYRGASFGVAREGVSRDGLHLDDYRDAYRSIDAEVCR